MKIALFGGTGFVGQYIVEELLNLGYNINIFVREQSKNKIRQSERINKFIGNIDDLKLIKNILIDCDVVIYLIGIIREFPLKGITFNEVHYEFTKNIIELSDKNNIKRFILMSANGVKEHGTKYQSTKWLADQILKKTTMDWTIFRPSLIFGEPNGKKEFCTQLRDDMLSLPFPAPLFHYGFIPENAGMFQMSPIHVEDIAKIFCMSIENKNLIKKIYNLGGVEKLSWKQIIKIISNSTAKTKWTIPAPVLPIKFLSRYLEHFSWFPVTNDQLTMLLEGNTCDSEEVFNMFNIVPKNFSKENLNYLKT